MRSTPFVRTIGSLIFFILPGPDVGLAEICGPSGATYLLADVSAARKAAAGQLQPRTLDQHAGDWANWCKYTRRVETPGGPFLAGVQKLFKRKVVKGFMSAVRNRRFSAQSGVGASSVRNAVNSVSAAYTQVGAGDPTKGVGGRLHKDIKILISAYEQMDPPSQRQPGLPPVVYRTIIRAS